MSRVTTTGCMACCWSPAAHSCQQVAELFGEDRRTVQRWVKRFESHGLEGVREGERHRPAGDIGR